MVYAVGDETCGGSQVGCDVVPRVAAEPRDKSKVERVCCRYAAVAGESVLGRRQDCVCDPMDGEVSGGGIAKAVEMGLGSGKGVVQDVGHGNIGCAVRGVPDIVVGVECGVG